MSIDATFRLPSSTSRPRFVQVHPHAKPASESPSSSHINHARLLNIPVLYHRKPTQKQSELEKKQEMSPARDTFTSILMLPWLAHGHISPFLQPFKRFADRDIHIYFCSTPVNLASMKPKPVGTKYFSKIKLVELHLPSLPELPPRNHTKKTLPPHLMLTLKKAFDMSSSSFRRYLEAS